MCNPQRAVQVLAQNMAVNTALLALFPGAAALKPVTEEVERETIRMIDEAR